MATTTKLVELFNADATVAAAATTTAFVELAYENLLGLSGDFSNKDERVGYWVGKINSGVVSKADFAATFLAAAAVQGDLLTNAEFAANTETLKAIAELDEATLTTLADVQAALETAGVVTPDTTGQTFTLTTSVDTLTGTANDDTFNATETATSSVLGGLDSIDGGAGTDTLNIADTSKTSAQDFNLPTGFKVSNVETVNVTANGSIGSAANAFDVSGMTGLTTFNAVTAGTAATTTNIKAAGTTEVNVTNAAGATTVNGGSSVSVTGPGAVTVTDAAGATGTTLTSVSINSASTNGVASTATGNGISSVTLSGTLSANAAAAANSLVITNATANHALTINAAGTGYKVGAASGDADVKVANGTVVTDTAATSLTINTTAKSALNVAGSSAAKSVTLTGAGDLNLATTAAATTAIDGSAATGNLSLNTLGTTVTSVKTGSGNDSFTTATTAKQTVDTGAGNDTVTLGAAVAAGSTINLGAGDDKLLVNGGTVAASTATATTVIDAGDGVDTLAANLVNAGNAAVFKNFEQLNLDSTTGLDLNLLAANNTLTGLTMSSASTNATYQNVSKALGLTVDYVGANAVTNTLQLSDVTGTADAYTITFNADNSSAATAPTVSNVTAGTLVTAGVENYSIVSGGSKAWNDVTLSDNTSANTVTITGAANIDLDFSAGATSFGSVTSGKTGVSSIDASAATGKVDIDVANVTAATAGLTVKGGSAADTLTTSTFATTLTGGAGADTFEVKATVAADTAAPVITTITDFVVGTDKLSFGTVGTDAFNATKVDVSTATALFGGTVNALDLAAAAANSTAGTQVTWFQYAGDTYVMQEVGNDAATTFGTDDVVVKLTGLVDLSTLVTADFTFA